MRARGLIAVLGLALLATCLAAALACGGRAVAPTDATASQPAPETSGAAPKEEVAKEEPRIVRWVCTDHLCGGCDGGCSRHGHVATHKDGHCACTPKEGGALDQATRKAFEGHEKGR